jgi:hypothetical protein
MSTIAKQLIEKVEANGGRFVLTGEDVTIYPATAAAPLAIELRRHRDAIIALIRAARMYPVAMERVPEGSMLDHDPTGWLEDFHRWALSCCFWRERSFQSVRSLHDDFCEWAAAHDSVPCRSNTFERLLAEEGFVFADGLVYGLILKSDWEQAMGRQAPAPGRLGENGSLVIDPMKPEET